MMEDTGKNFVLGQHEARLDNLERMMTETSTDVKAIRAVIERGKGSWKMLTILGVSVTALVEGVHQLAGLFHK